MEVEEMEEEEEVESVDMEVDTNGGMSVLSCREQDSLVANRLQKPWVAWLTNRLQK